MANYNDKKYKFGAENLTALNATQLTSGTVPDARFTTLPAVSGAALTALNASNLGSGTIPTARLGSGTASSSTVLYGDQSYKAEPSGSLSTKVVSGTRNHNSGSGNVAISGAGFTPTAVMLVISSNNETSGWGIGSSGSQMSHGARGGSTAGEEISGSAMGCCNQGGNGRWAASLTSLDADGATIYFTRVGNYRHLNWAVCFMR